MSPSDFSNEASLLDPIEQLPRHCSEYRAAVDRLLASPNADAAEWQIKLREILISSVRLYLDYQTTTCHQAILREISKRRKSIEIDRESGHQRWEETFKRVGEVLKDSKTWNSDFVPTNPFSEITGLQSREDYELRFITDLPDIYGETVDTEAYAKHFSSTRCASTLEMLLVGLQHLGRNHISFLIPALEWASDEMSWKN